MLIIVDMLSWLTNLSWKFPYMPQGTIGVEYNQNLRSFHPSSFINSSQRGFLFRSHRISRDYKQTSRVSLALSCHITHSAVIWLKAHKVEQPGCMVWTNRQKYSTCQELPTWLTCSIFCCGKVQCFLDISRSIFVAYLTKDTPYLAREGEVLGVVGECKLDRYFIIVILVLSALSYHI